MDYEVFLLSRIREEWLRTHDNRQAVVRGLEKTGGVITNAALLFVIVTGAFTFTSLVATKEIGVGMTVAVLVDATIIRSLLVPGDDAPAGPLELVAARATPATQTNKPAAGGCSATSRAALEKRSEAAPLMQTLTGALLCYACALVTFCSLLLAPKLL